MSALPRVRSGLVAVLMLASALVATLAPAAVTTPVAAAATPAVSTSHPYSAPIWYPLRDKVYLDCVLTNPGCKGVHAAWTMDMVLETLGGTPPSNPGVYAMGAGILHVENAHGDSCSSTRSSVDFGTTVTIDHGGGIVSRYGHLASIAVRDGSYVAAGQRIATMGTTGKDGNCSVPYLDFQIREHGAGGPRVPMPTLKYCRAGGGVGTWPNDLTPAASIRPYGAEYRSLVKSHYTDFNQIPQRTLDFPATSGSCIPGSVPATPSRPAWARLARSGRGRLTASWAAPAATPGTSSIQVQLSEYHPSTHTWDYSQNEEYRTVSTRTRSYAFSGLVSGHRYRATVVFRNGTGNSIARVTSSVVSAAAPARPSSRTLSYTRHKNGVGIHFGWKRPRSYGASVTGYRVGIRTVKAHGRPSAWRTRYVSGAHASYYWRNQHKHRHYQVRVQALSSAGNSGFLVRNART